MAGVMIGVDPHKASHTAVAIGASEEVLGQVRVRASASQARQLLAWSMTWPERTWAVEGAGGLGHLLAQQLLSAGERVLDVQPKLGARVRLLATGNVNKNDPNDARSVAVAALRSVAVAALRPGACRPGLWPGFRTTCLLTGPRRGVARKRRERPVKVFWNQACPPRVYQHLGGGAVHGRSDDRG